MCNYLFYKDYITCMNLNGSILDHQEGHERPLGGRPPGLPGFWDAHGTFLASVNQLLDISVESVIHITI